MKTRPKHWLDFIFWPLLKISWELFSLKESHWWHWKEFTGEIKKSFICKGIPNEKPREGFWPNFWQTNFGWKKIYILKPTSYKDEYQIGFECGTRKQLCSVILKGRVGILIGPDDTTFFAIDLNGNYINLICRMDIINKKEFKKEKIPLI